MATTVAIDTQSPAHALADHIVAEIHSRQSQPGTVVASLTELRERYNVGRPVAKQAVRILEERGIAFMRRGSNGGLIVATPSSNFASRGLSILIEYEMESLMDVGPLPMAIDAHLYLHQAPKLGLDACENLRRLAQKLDRLSHEEFLRTGAHRQLYNAIRMASGDPTLNLAQQTSYECAFDLIPYSVAMTGESRDSTSWQLSLEVVEALIAGNTAHLFYCLRRQVAMMQKGWDQWSAIEKNPSLAPNINDPSRPEFKDPNNRADRLTRELLREIRALNWIEGERIGSNVELMARYQTSPDTLRQAVLILQEHGVIEVEKGRSGGLYVASPKGEKAIKAAQQYLQNSHASQESLSDFLMQLVLQAFEGFPLIQPERLQSNAKTTSAWLVKKQSTLPQTSFWQMAAQLCNNPVLRTFTRVIEPLLTAPINSAEQHNYKTLLQTIAAGDLSKGRRLLLLAAPTNNH